MTPPPHPICAPAARTSVARALLPVLLTPALSLLGAPLAAAQGLTPAVAVSAPAPAAGDLLGLDRVTVQRGDTAFSLARRAGLRVETLLSLNGLSTPDLRVGQVLRLREAPTLTAVPPAPLTHAVQPGETLYALSRRYGVSVDALLAGNDLPPDAVLRAGQVLRLPAGAHDGGHSRSVVNGSVVAAPVPAPAAPGVSGSPFLPVAPPQVTPVLHPAQEMPRVQRSAPGALATPLAAPQATDWRSAALALLGTPYRFGGEAVSGADCSGFVRLVFTPLGVNLPRVSADQAQAGQPVADSDLRPGDLLFFDTEGRGRVSHVGIYLGDDSFVSANSYQGRVSVDRLLADRYWGPRYLWARRVLSSPVALGR